jgi:hypothetical protein
MFLRSARGDTHVSDNVWLSTNDVEAGVNASLAGEHAVAAMTGGTACFLQLPSQARSCLSVLSCTSLAG